MAFTPALTFLVLVLATSLTVGTACNIDAVRNSSQEGPMSGGWVAANDSDATVARLKQDAIGKTNDITDAHHVIEAYSQVVEGYDYCIRFSASGRCSDLYCKSFECTAGGLLPPSSDKFTGISIDCQLPIPACNIDAARESANQGPMPGGWVRASANDNTVGQLHKTASTIGSVQNGDIIEAYSQVVAGTNYCIHFKSSPTKDCDSNCKPLKCVAGGFVPLPANTNNPDLVTRIGISCKPDGQGPDGSTTTTTTDGSTAVAPVLMMIISLSTFAILLH